MESNTALSFHAQVSISGNELCLMTSHLESTKDHSKERVKQLQIVLNKMQEESESTTVIFGGDTNLRDSEVIRDKQPGYSKVFLAISSQTFLLSLWKMNYTAEICNFLVMLFCLVVF